MSLIKTTAARAVILWESLARVANSQWLWKQLECHGLHQMRNVPEVAVVEEDTKDVRPKHIRVNRDRVMRNLTGGRKNVVLLVGNVALECVTGKRGIKQQRGRPFEVGNTIYVPTLPPGVALYDAKTIPMLEADLRLFAECVRKGRIPREDLLDWRIVRDEDDFGEMLADLHGTVSFDIETNGLYAWAEGAKVISIGFGTRKRQWCLPLHHPESPWKPHEHAALFAAIDERLADCQTVAQNGKFDSVWLRVHYGIDWRCDFDTMLAHYTLDENSRHGLKYLAQVFCGAPNYDADLDTKKGAGPLDKHCLYLAHDVYYTRRLRFIFGKELEKDPGVERCFNLLVMPIASLFCDIEFHGVLVDYDRYEEAEVYLRNELESARRELIKHGDINWGSPKQLAKLLFDDLGITPLDKTKGGKANSTSESVLLRIDHPIAVALLKYRGADQNLKMFIDGWRGFLVKHADGWRLHPSFKLHGTVTGRASCEHPNLQQVPRESLIRSLIGAPRGWGLLEIDLSQIEMRIAAELSGDETLLGLFDRDEDVHWMTALREIGRAGSMAKEVVETASKHLGKRVDYSVALEALYKMGPDRAQELWSGWKELRKKAKAINFGYLFGMWWKKFKIYARDNYGIEVTDRQAQESRKNFFELYKRLSPWHERQRQFARRNGYVRSLTGGKRRLPDAQRRDDCYERAEAWRQAINSPVQRFACEINFMTLIQLQREFGTDVLRPVGTVHDATLIEVRNDHIERVTTRALEIMTHPSLFDDFGIKLRVPIKGDAKIGSWSKGVSLDKWRTANLTNGATRAKNIVTRKVARA